MALLTIGDQFPAYNLTAVIGGDLSKVNAQQPDDYFTTVTSDDHAGKWRIVFFWPKDFTFVCPTELEDLGEHYATLQKLGVEVFGVSTDTHFSHKAWHDTSEKIGKLKYAFLGDQMHTLSNNFGFGGHNACLVVTKFAG